MPPTRSLGFRWPWRPYQERVLAAVDRHLEDDRLHIVAAPGAGKTTLGLEVFRRLHKPALVLTPTLTIRDQWLRRLDDFLPPEERGRPVAWSSSDLASPSYFTVATYQAVLAKSRADEAVVTEPTEDDSDRATGPDAVPSAEEVQTLIDVLRAGGVGTIILDEAHHLKREWWRALEGVARAIEGATLVSLTGTPPYDATGVEWRRYEELCGPIDEEISVPELVKAGTLCAHQDFVYAVAPRDDEAAEVRGHDESVRAVLGELLEDPRFQQEVDGHPWVVSQTPDLEAVLENPEVAVALLAYLRATGAGLPPLLLDSLALGAGDLPRLDRRWWQVLLKEYLHGRSFEANESYRRDLAKSLRASGLLWRRSLRIERSVPSERTLALSTAKIEACVEIHRAERSVRGHTLRQVVLTDYIRDESLGSAVGTVPQDLGAFPIFDALRTASGDEDLALVSGRLSILHETRLADLRTALGQGAQLTSTGLVHRSGWRRIDGVSSGALVAAFTELLRRGVLRVIVGTRSLLGEGWDAPSVNSLVLASFVGAFVSTNQMRGRAIRRDPGTRGKVASVWHLVAVAHETPTGFLDYEQLERRFATFVGLAHDANEIESGLGRLRLPPLRRAADMEPFNAESLGRLERLDAVAEGWRSAIDDSGSGQVVPTISFGRAPTLRPMLLTRTLRYVLYETGFAAALTIVEVLRRLSAGGGGAIGIALLVAAGLPMIMLAPRLLHAARLAFLHAPVAGSVTQIGKAVLEALRAMGLVEGDGLGLRTGRTPAGGVHVALDGGTIYEQALFADSMGEILGPVENPRYLITRPVNDFMGARVDYHAVPHRLSVNRERADSLHRAWLRHVGPGELIYTRKAGGRAELLAARGRAFSNQFVDPAQRLDRWQ